MRAVADRLGDVALSDLLPGIALDDQTRLGEIGDWLDNTRLASDRAEWRWYPEKVVPVPHSPGEPKPLILGTALTVYSGGGDWLELALDVWQSVPPRMLVTAGVEVGCWCTTDHNMHVVAAAEWPIETMEALPAAFQAAAEAIVAWLAGPHEPAAWRERLNLPNPG